MDGIDLKTARILNRQWHSLLPRFGIGAVKNAERRFLCFGASHDGVIYAVAIWSLPGARQLPQDGTWLELRRLAVAPDAPRNTASRMLAVMARLIRRLRPECKTLCSSQDTSKHTGGIYRAAGWKPTFRSKGGEWDCVSRPRPKVQSDAPKQRWEKALE